MLWITDCPITPHLSLPAYLLLALPAILVHFWFKTLIWPAVGVLAVTELLHLEVFGYEALQEKNLGEDGPVRQQLVGRGQQHGRRAGWPLKSVFCLLGVEVILKQPALFPKGLHFFCISEQVLLVWR